MSISVSKTFFLIYQENKSNKCFCKKESFLKLGQFQFCSSHSTMCSVFLYNRKLNNLSENIIELSFFSAVGEKSCLLKCTSFAKFW